MRRVVEQRAACRLGRRARPASNEGSAALGGLGERFAQFRAERGRGARVPAELRGAALAALREGMTPGDLSRVCRVSWSQLVAWKARSAEAVDARVFSVVDEERVAQQDSEPARPAEQAIELRVGSWSISVRLTEAGRNTGRG